MFRREWRLIVRRETGSRDTIKYSLSNAPQDADIRRLAYMQGQRYFVEQAFQDAKSSADIAGLPAHFLPRRDITRREVLRQMEFLHRQRQASIDSAYARNG